MASHRVRIEFCTTCNYGPRAIRLSDELLEEWTPAIASLELVPSSGGVFEVTIDNELVFSKRALGRHAHEAEIASLARAHLGDSDPRP